MLHGNMVSTDELSSGYHDIMNLFADILSGFPEEFFRDARNMSGIVMLDELGAHLHPRWQMQIVDSLKNTFPGIQFLTSTHHPLCLRGLVDGEVVVFERRGASIRVNDQPPSPRFMRVDQLLTSRLFGLSSTIDLDLDAEFDEYYEFVIKAPLTPVEEARKNGLRVKLASVSTVGATRRDQLINEFLDEYIAREMTMDPAALVPFKESTRQRVWQRWRELEIEDL
jgi:AAA domain, putative AbiEii toxin, Type IV TA system